MEEIPCLWDPVGNESSLVGNPLWSPNFSIMTVLYVLSKDSMRSSEQENLSLYETLGKITALTTYLMRSAEALLS